MVSAPEQPEPESVKDQVEEALACSKLLDETACGAGGCLWRNLAHLIGVIDVCISAGQAAGLDTPEAQAALRCANFDGAACAGAGGCVWHEIGGHETCISEQQSAGLDSPAAQAALACAALRDSREACCGDPKCGWAAFSGHETCTLASSSAAYGKEPARPCPKIGSTTTRPPPGSTSAPTREGDGSSPIGAIVGGAACAVLCAIAVWKRDAIKARLGSRAGGGASTTTTGDLTGVEMTENPITPPGTPASAGTVPAEKVEEADAAMIAAAVEQPKPSAPELPAEGEATGRDQADQVELQLT